MGSKEFDKIIYYGHLVQGKLRRAVEYLKQSDSQFALYKKHIDRFENERYLSYDVDESLNDVLHIYQQYFRDVFYLEAAADNAAQTMTKRFAALFGITDKAVDLDGIEQSYIAPMFEKRSYRFLGGRTGGYYGPYIWSDTELKRYDVELPDGKQSYSVKLLDGFIFKSWLDYISFGAIGTGGWTDDDGVINCVKSAYDFESESFTVSLLKHEAQHANDKENFDSMNSEDLEYRAKLVELIYSTKRNLLKSFASEADNSNGDNAHSIASNKIISNFKKRSAEPLSSLSIADVQTIARELFADSDKEMKAKYSI